MSHSSIFSGLRSVWIKFKSWRTRKGQSQFCRSFSGLGVSFHALTCYAGEQLPGEVLDLAVRKRDKAVALEKVENALAQKIHDDANVAAVVETVPQMNASIPVLFIIGLERSQDAKLDPGSVAIFLDGSNNLDSHRLVPLNVAGLNHLAKGTLSKKTNNLI